MGEMERSVVGVGVIALRLRASRHFETSHRRLDSIDSFKKKKFDFCCSQFDSTNLQLCFLQTGRSRAGDIQGL